MSATLHRQRGFIFPVDFFARPSVRRLMRKWDRAIEWWMALCILARESCNEGRIEAGGRPIPVDELHEYHLHEMDPQFIQALLDQAMIELDDDGCAFIPQWEDWYRNPKIPPSRTREAARNYKREQRKKLSAPCPEDVRIPSAPCPEDVRIPSAPPQQQPQQQPQPEQQPDPSVQPENFGQPAGDTPAPPDGRTFFDIEETGEIVHKVLLPSAIYTSTKRKQVLAFAKRNLGRPTGMGVVSHDDLVTALRYAQESTLHAIRSPTRGSPLGDPWAYALSVAQEKLARVVDHREAQEIAKRHGLDNEGPLQFRPTEVTLDTR